MTGVETVDELTDLPLDAVLRDATGTLWRVDGRTWWHERAIAAGPLALVWRPDRPYLIDGVPFRFGADRA